MTAKRIAVLGAGGLGRTMAQILERKTEFNLVAICDTHGVAFDAGGISGELVNLLETGVSVGTLEIGRLCDDPIGEIIKLNDEIDGVFLALPNLPNEFIPSIVKRFAECGFQGVMVDALKRTGAVKLMLELRELLAERGVTYVTGCGATPGLLTAAAALASQSFMEIEDVTIYFGVGIENWDAYRATIREDIAHMDGFNVEIAGNMTDDEVEAELDKRDGKLELVNMEHADDIMLEDAGVLQAANVSVGGIVDTRSAKKPVSTHVKITGVTFEGKRSSHTFTLGDETSMAANVNGPALGYMKAGFWFFDKAIHGVYTAAELMPRFVR